MYNIYCQPVLQHIAQFYPINKHVLNTEREALQQLPVAPRYSMTSALMYDLENYGISCQARSVEPHARAALFRAAVRSDEFARARDQLG